MRKNSAKVRKKILRENSANFAQKIQPFRGNPTHIFMQNKKQRQNKDDSINEGDDEKIITSKYTTH